MVVVMVAEAIMRSWCWFGSRLAAVRSRAKINAFALWTSGRRAFQLLGA